MSFWREQLGRNAAAMRGEALRKVVLAGAPGAGKASCLRATHEQVAAERRGAIGEDEGTLCCELQWPDFPPIRGIRLRSELVALSSRRSLAEQRRWVRGLDGVVFVVDARERSLEAGLEAFEALLGELRDHGHEPARLPLVLLYTRCELPGALPRAQLDELFTAGERPVFVSTAPHDAIAGQAVQACLRQVWAEA